MEFGPATTRRSYLLRIETGGALVGQFRHVFLAAVPLAGGQVCLSPAQGAIEPVS